MKITEENVVQQIKKRNEKSVMFIIQTYGGLLSVIIKRYVQSNQQDYEECLDDVLLAIWFHIDSFDSSKNTFKQWIAAIAKYRAIDYQRKNARNQQQTVCAEINDRLYQEQRKSKDFLDVQELLSELSATERNIFEKYYLEGVPSREIASHLNVKESWIHNKLSRGRKKLKQIFIFKNGV
ncbi:sigma-70 family RNA polymerase sigma factor [Bacillus sp. TH22]|uniref:sigma-70 family RNA polymerase sigma factor n=1 Tax=unclassified Bacillus (in: firmicutes) TaxID=185979 RepID=UPI0019139B7A|nr:MULTISPECIES: sigma-70 family RNA polymerase sigma factor [unclassified Bacillus (in: firmicutes)]MBK5448816.1 sigma-70 family RNA polymerase sigma factor [Bacillus sp. TH22]MBK5457245.1 sigma-70 family RNA polymerase sigma factor [Bacillus sp. TH23]